MALSGLAMVAAAFGWLTPVAGALTQEVIDVAVILNALRALTPGRRLASKQMPTATAHALQQEHQLLEQSLDRLREIADALDDADAQAAAVLIGEAERIVAQSWSSTSATTKARSIRAWPSTSPTATGFPP